MTRRRRIRRTLIGIAAAPVLAAVVLGAEVQLARRGPDLPDDTPLQHDGLIGGGGGAGSADVDPLRITWLGDSTAAGVGASSADEALPRRVALALDRAVEVSSLAVSGARLGDVLGRQLPRLATLRPDIVIVSIGANDAVHLTSLGTFRDQYTTLVRSIPSGTLLVLLGVPDMGAPPRFLQPLRAIAGLRGRQLDQVTRTTAERSGASYVDIAGQTGPVMRSDPGRYFAADRYHPSDDGYALWARAVVDELGVVLADRGAADAAG